MKVQPVAFRFPVLVALVLALALPAVMAQGGVAFGDQTMPAKKAEAKGQKAVPPCCAAMGENMPEACKKAMAGRMAKWKQMQEKMDAQDAKLNSLVAEMNAASGDKKIDAMAAALSELVAQHTSRRKNMMAMRAEMMKDCPMGPAGGPMMMENCPMMKGRGGSSGSGASESKGGGASKPGAPE